MLREQQLKIRKGWQWVEGQLARGYLTVNGNDTGRLCYRVDLVVGNVPYALLEGERYPINLADPVLADAATADGMMRTCSVMWAHVLISSGMVVLIRRGNQWVVVIFDWEKIELTHIAIGEGETMKEALLAAILAAPEADNAS